MPRSSTLAGTRNRLGSSSLTRRAGRAPVRSHVAIVAYDGEKTEADYFRGWRRVLGTRGVVLKPFYVKSGGNAYHAVQESVKIAKADSDYDEFWCVCDLDLKFTGRGICPLRRTAAAG